MAYIPVIENARIAANAVTTDKVLNATLTDVDIAAANKDGAAGTASMRTLGTGAGQALAGTTTLDAITAPTSSVSLNSQTITNLADPTSAQDAATKAYVDAVASGLDPKASVLYTTTGNITLSGTAVAANGTWPGALTAGDRILVKDQTSADENGIYDAAAGAWVRSSDFDGNPSSEVTNGAFTLVSADDGSAQVGTGWVVTSADPIVVDTDPIDFTQITSPGAVSVLNDLTDVDTTGVVDGALLRYESSPGVWNDSTSALLTDAGRLRLTTTGSFAGIEIGNPDSVIYRSSAALLKTDAAFTVEAPLSTTALMTMGGGQRVSVETIVANKTIFSNSDYLIIADSSVSLRTVTLGAGHVSGDTFVVKRLGAGFNVNVATQGGALIDGVAAPFVIATDKEAFLFVSDGTNWIVI